VYIIVLQQLILYKLCKDIILFYDITAASVIFNPMFRLLRFLLSLPFIWAPFRKAFVVRLGKSLDSHVAAWKLPHLNQRFPKTRRNSGTQQVLEISRLSF
jgi:hypothetical protein